MATHSEADGHEIPSRSLVPSIAEWSFHAAAPPVGFVEVSELPLLSTAAQKPVDGHDTAVRMLPESIRAGDDHWDDPPAGLVDVNTWPALSTATQRAAVGHERPRMMLLLSMAAGDDQVEARLAGFESVSTFPTWSPATHRDGTHEMARKRLLPSMFSTFHAAAPPVGLFDRTALPASSTAAQKCGVVHDTARSACAPSGGSTSVRGPHANGPAARAEGAARSASTMTKMA